MLFRSALGLLAVIAFIFALRAKHAGDRRANLGLYRFQLGCGLVIVGALAVALSGWFASWRAFGLTPLYIGEVVTVFAFGLCWIAQGRDLRKWLNAPPTEAGGG